MVRLNLGKVVILCFCFMFLLVRWAAPQREQQATPWTHKGSISEIAPIIKATGLPEGVKLREIDGGASYFANISPSSAWMDKNILLGAVLLQPLNSAHVAHDISLGSNIYWTLAGNPSDTKDCGGWPCRADYRTIRDGGMHTIAPEAFDGAMAVMDTGRKNSSLLNGSETVGWFGLDEADMSLGPGWGAWTGTTAEGSCVEGQSSRCGYTASRFYYNGNHGAGVGTATLNYPIDGRVVYQNFGKGVLYWEPDSDAKVWLTFSDILSADEFWFVDSDVQSSAQGGCALFPGSTVICGYAKGSGLTAEQSRLAANYEFNINRLRYLQSLNGPTKPILGIIETGCPFNNGSCTTPAQMAAAAWHSIIAGARGINWFQHNFSGPCVNFNVFYDGSNPASPKFNCQQSPGVALHDVAGAVMAVNKKIASLNSVLLSPFADGYVTADGLVSVMAKYDTADNSFYIFAGSSRPGTPAPPNQSVTFTLAGAPTATITVLDENRTLSAVRGVFSDTFADDNTIHIYKIINAACSPACSR